MFAVTRLRNYLLGKHFTVLVDYCALCASNARMPKSARLHRWQLILSEYDFTIRYIKGGLHIDVDCLSRAPLNEKVDNYLDDKLVAAIRNPTPVANYNIDNSNIAVTARDTQEWKQATQNDPEAQAHLVKARCRQKGYKIHNGCLYYENRLYVPSTIRENLISQRHADEPSCHGGVRATLERMAELWWSSMADDVRKHVSSCDICQARKAQRTLPSGSMVSFQGYEPFDIVAFNVLGALPPSLRDNRYVIVGIDCFTRFMDAVAVSDQKAETFVTYLKAFIGRFGIPKTILTDNSNLFVNSSVTYLADKLNIELRQSMPHHHEGNVVVERAIGRLQEKLALISHDPIATVD